MSTLFKLFVTGYIVSLACISYLSFRTYRTLGDSRLKYDPKNFLKEAQTSDSRSLFWLGMAILSGIISYGWSIVAVGIYYALEDKVLFVQISCGLAILLATAIALTKTHRKWDKVAMSVIVILGIGALIPALF